jgi:flagellar hook-basal body complex protein FliE
MQLLILLKCASTRQHTAHADDVSLLGRSVKAIREVVTQLKEAALSMELVTKREQKKIHRNITDLEKI